MTIDDHRTTPVQARVPVGRRISFVLLAVSVLGMTSACGGGPAPQAAPATVTVVQTVPATTPPTATPPTAVALPAAPQQVPQVAATWTMPDLVGRGLQEAQDAIQSLTGYGIAVTTSHDGTGAGRMQVSDRNWTVCDQNVVPGAAITSGTRIDFGAVKLGEAC